MIRVVFGGPSFHGVDHRLYPAIDFRPPAAAGAILRAALDGAGVIGLVDGVFEAVPSVWHKEILYALHQGRRVFGAASLGALRAAECADFGMTGVGAVFASYATGARTADADVALIHAPAELDYAPLTVPMTDIEHWLGGAVTPGGLALLRAIHFKERTLDAALAVLRDNGEAAMAAGLTSYRPEQGVKSRDARELLDAVSRAGGPHAPLAAFSHTGYFEVLARRVAGATR